MTANIIHFRPPRRDDPDAFALASAVIPLATKQQRINIVDIALDAVTEALHRDDPAKAREILNDALAFIDLMWPETEMGGRRG